MDSRKKIVDVAEAALPAGRRVVLACCDPLLPQHAHRFREFAQSGKLLIVIDRTVPSYMEAAARAVLAASLACVETVVLGDRGVARQLDSSFDDLSAEEAVWRESFFEHVRKKGS